MTSIAIQLKTYTQENLLPIFMKMTWTSFEICSWLDIYNHPLLLEKKKIVFIFLTTWRWPILFFPLVVFHTKRRKVILQKCWLRETCYELFKIALCEISINGAGYYQSHKDTIGHQKFLELCCQEMTACFLEIIRYIQFSAIITWLFFSKILTIKNSYLTCDGKVFGEFQFKSMFYLE